MHLDAPSKATVGPDAWRDLAPSLAVSFFMLVVRTPNVVSTKRERQTIAARRQSISSMTAIGLCGQFAERMKERLIVCIESAGAGLNPIWWTD